MRIKYWTKLSSPQLWEAWQANFPSETEAEVTAIWIANRLVKDHARSVRRAFYEAKDIFIRSYQKHLTEGRCVRVERRSCRDCRGSGEDGDDCCDRCEGTGIYSERTLFCHYFVIAGQRYSFHSYEKPAKISSEPGEDKEEYGGRFSEDEIKEMMLPMSGLLRMLGWVAAARGFRGGSAPVQGQPEYIQDVLEIPAEAGGKDFREDDLHPANCFCRFGQYLSVYQKM